MASSSKQSCVRFTAEELSARSDCDAESGLDSDKGGLSSGEEFELD